MEAEEEQKGAVPLGHRSMKDVAGAAVSRVYSVERTWRPEIQGLRALALLLVAAYHFWFGRVSGGVDVFLFVSAFLLTGSFARRIESGRFAAGGIWDGIKAVFAQWVHTFKRLLPLATLTVALTLLGTYFFIPAERWLAILDEAVSVVFYQQNWWSIDNAVDYYAADSSQASPLRHFWSLSVQGQIYLLWPLVFLAAALVIRARRGRGVRTTLITVFALIFAGSLAYSVYATEANQLTAYFNTWARLWEFALGSLVALILPMLNLPRTLRAVLGWVGIVAIISCGFVLDVNGSFPGYVALWPTLAASFIIAAGNTDTRFGPEKLLTARPLLALGGFSYALYLVHWPILVFYLSYTKQEKAGFAAGLLLLALSMALAWLLTRLVEKPLRTWSLPNRSVFTGLVTISVCLGLGVAPSYSWNASIQRQAVQAELHRETNNVGAAMLDSTYEYTGDDDPTVIPIRAVLDADWAELGGSCAELAPELELPEHADTSCTVPVPNEDPTRRVLVVGNSHMQMWLTALRPLAESQGWELVALIRPGCFLTPEDNAEFASGASCEEWATASWDFIDAHQPDTLVLNGTRSLADEPDVLLTGLEPRIARLTAGGTTVIGIRDTPRMSQMHKDCMDSFGSAEDCMKNPGQDVLEDPQGIFEELYPGFAAVNLSDLICPENACPPTIGNVYTYFDYDHITATYIETLGGYFDPRVLDAVDRADAGVQISLVPWPLPPDGGE